ncbi:hypothetical protein MNV49_003549 [Pseudohyphozyma bogoriensis]|nr:hypothetical protein MNV49_003549 [Pseudohyphozyma bogoriensis]
MAPLTQGIKTTYSHTTDTGGSVYNGNFDSEFGFGPMVHGGIIISTILSAALSHQSRTSSPHIDPMNLSAEFLSPPHFGPAEIHITPSEEAE